MSIRSLMQPGAFGPEALAVAPVAAAMKCADESEIAPSALAKDASISEAPRGRRRSRTTSEGHMLVRRDVSEAGLLDHGFR
jgi:hypothetical protein